MIVKIVIAITIMLKATTVIQEIQHCIAHYKLPRQFVNKEAAPTIAKISCHKVVISND